MFSYIGFGAISLTNIDAALKLGIWRETEINVNAFQLIRHPPASQLTSWPGRKHARAADQNVYVRVRGLLPKEEPSHTIQELAKMPATSDCISGWSVWPGSLCFMPIPHQRPLKPLRPGIARRWAW